MAMNTTPSVSKNNSLKYKVVIGFVLVLSALGFASYISYQSFEDLTRAVNIISSPDPTVEQIEPDAGHDHPNRKRTARVYNL